MKTILWDAVAVGCFVMLAAHAGAQNLDLSQGGADPIWHGVEAGAKAGAWLDQGDLNGSTGAGRRDLIVGSMGSSSVHGRVYVIFGGPVRSGDISLANADVVIDGLAAGDRFGQATAAGNVVTMEGSAARDLVVGAPGALGNRGIVYLFRGPFANGTHLSTANAVLRVIGDTNDELGAALATGDMNNDGFREIIIGAPGTGRIYVINGGANVSGTIDLSNQNASFAFSGTGIGAVLAAGDVTGDNIFDLLIGAPSLNTTYLVRGHSGPFPSVLTLPASADSVFTGIDPGDRAGAAIRVLDFDGDGKRDVAIGAPAADGPNNGRPDAGEVYLLWGGGGMTSRSLADADVTFYGISSFLQTGAFIAAGDINRDTPNDLVFLAAGGSNGAGELHLYYGRPRSTIGTLQANGRRVVDLAATGQISRRILGDGTKGPITSALVYEVTGEGARDIIAGIPAAASSAGNVYFTISPRMALSPSAKAFSLAEGGSAASTFVINNASMIPITWTATTAQPWLNVTPGNGGASSTSPASVTIGVSAATLPAGSYSGTIQVKSTSPDLVMTLPVSVSLTVAENRHMGIIAPSTGATLTQPIVVRGWAIDTSVPTGTGVDAVDIYGGADSSSLVLLGHAVYGLSNPEVGSTYGSRFTNSGFELSVRGLPAGPVTIVAKARTAGQTPFWTKAGGSVNLTTTALPSPDDFSGDRRMDLLWQHSDGWLALWKMNGASLQDSVMLTPDRVSDTNWHIVATGDMNGDGKADILWQYSDGSLAVWLMNGTTLVDGAILNPSKPDRPGWRVAGSADVNGDGKDDIIWQHETEGWLAVWLMNGINIIDGQMLVPNHLDDPAWKIIGTGDVNGDGKADILFRHAKQGWLAVWYMNGPNLIDGRLLNPISEPDLKWRVAAIGDLDGDSKIDFVWQNDVTGALRVWFMNGPDLIRSTAIVPGSVPTSWQLVGPK